MLKSKKLAGTALVAFSFAFAPGSSMAAVKGEAEMVKLGECVAEKGKDKCMREAKAACSVIFNAAFTPGASSPSQIKKWEAAGKPSRWKKATANLVLSKVGFGRNFCG